LSLKDDRERMTLIGNNARERIHRLCDKQTNLKLMIDQFMSVANS
jgi:hypothetical protein